jgi:hypothetical protein
MGWTLPGSAARARLHRTLEFRHTLNSPPTRPESTRLGSPYLGLPRVNTQREERYKPMHKPAPTAYKSHVAETT